MEFTNFPYRACSCGDLVRWAFDPGGEFSEQLFYVGLPVANARRGKATCRACGADLGAPEPVVLSATANLDGLAPIGARVTLVGYRCAACGLEQAMPHAFDVSQSGARSSEVGEALDDAVSSLGLTV